MYNEGRNSYDLEVAHAINQLPYDYGHAFGVHVHEQ